MLIDHMPCIYIVLYVADFTPFYSFLLSHTFKIISDKEDVLDMQTCSNYLHNFQSDIRICYRFYTLHNNSMNILLQRQISFTQLKCSYEETPQLLFAKVQAYKLQM